MSSGQYGSREDVCTCGHQALYHQYVGGHKEATADRRKSTTHCRFSGCKCKYYDRWHPGPDVNATCECGHSAWHHNHRHEGSACTGRRENGEPCSCPDFSARSDPPEQAPSDPLDEPARAPEFLSVRARILKRDTVEVHVLLREAGGRYINVLYDLATEGIRALAFHREQLEWKVLLIDQVDRIHTIVCHMLFGSGPLPSPVLDDALRALDGGTASPLTTPDPPPAMGKVPCDHPAAERESWVGWLVHHCRKCGASIQDRP